MAEEQSQTRAEWLEPPAEQQGLQRYVGTIRERAWLIVLITIVTTAAAIVYVLTAPKVYEAQADLLITPVSPDNTTLTSLGLITASSDPTRDVETAAQLVTTNEVSARAKRTLGAPESPRDLLGEIEAEPVAQSTIVSVTAKGDSPEEARDRANAFAAATVADRTANLHTQIDLLLPGVRAQVAQEPEPPGGGGTTPLEAQLSQLELLRQAPDPTFRVATVADTPTRQASPRPVLSIAGGLLAGLIFGVIAAFGIQVLDPRLRREEQLRRSYRLPILGRIPRQPQRSRSRGARNRPIGPGSLSRAAAEAYRTLRTTLSAAGGNGRAILVTGTQVSEGKTTTALNLASSLALAGNQVILIEADLRRPALANALGIEVERGVVNVLIENLDLEDALVQSESYGPNLSLLLADYEGGWVADLFAIPAAQRMVEEAKIKADYVVIDSPPLNEVVDALPMARAADDVLIVVRLGEGRLARIAQLTELLADNGVRPIGFVVVGVAPPDGSSYHEPSGEVAGAGRR